MADTFKFELVSPEKIMISTDVAEVVVPGAEGDFTVLPLHAPVIALLRPGVLRIPGMDGNLGEIYVRGGLAEVGPERLTILAEQAIPLSEVDRALIAREIKDAEEDLAGTHDEFTRRQAEETLDRLRNLSEALNLAA